MPGNDGRREGERLRVRKAREPPVQVPHDDVGGEPVLVALVPRLERDEVERVVGREREAQQAEAGHARVVLDARRLLEDRVDLVVDRRRCAAARRRAGAAR